MSSIIAEDVSDVERKTAEKQQESTGKEGELCVIIGFYSRNVTFS